MIYDLFIALQELFECRSLCELYVGDNDIAELPSSLAGLSKLRHLDISKNGECFDELNIAWLRLPNLGNSRNYLRSKLICIGAMQCRTATKLQKGCNSAIYFGKAINTFSSCFFFLNFLASHCMLIYEQSYRR